MGLQATKIPPLRGWETKERPPLRKAACVFGGQSSARRRRARSDAPYPLRRGFFGGFRGLGVGWFWLT
jgi:hypothetical protein